MTDLERAVSLFRLCHRRQAWGFMKYHGNGPQRNLFADCLEEIADGINMCQMLQLKLDVVCSPPEAQHVRAFVTRCQGRLIEAATEMFRGMELTISGGSLRALLDEPECNRIGWKPNPWEGDAVEPISSDTAEASRDVRSSDSQPPDPRTACVGGS